MARQRTWKHLERPDVDEGAKQARWKRHCRTMRRPSRYRPPRVIAQTAVVQGGYKKLAGCRERPSSPSRRQPCSAAPHRLRGSKLWRRGWRQQRRKWRLGRQRQKRPSWLPRMLRHGASGRYAKSESVWRRSGTLSKKPSEPWRRGGSRQSSSPIPRSRQWPPCAIWHWTVRITGP